jgi:hypothetical protein
MMQAVLKCSGRIVDVEPIPGDADRMIVFGNVFYRIGWDAAGFRPIHIVPLDKLEITTTISGKHANETQGPSH